MSRRLAWIGAVIVAALAIGAAIAMKRSKPAAETPAPRPAAARVLEFAPADLARAEPGEIRRELPVTGVLKPVTQTVVKAKVSGELIELGVREGQSVSAGQVIARIDPTEYQSRLAERMGSAEAARVQWRYAEQTRRNNEELLRRNYISKNAYDSWSTNSGVGEAQVKAAEASVELARKALADTVVRAPVSGEVAERLVQAGEKVAVDGRLLVLVDLAKLELELAVPAADIPSVSIGQDVEFAVEGFGDRRFTGTVTRINPSTLAGTRSILLYVEVPNPRRELRGGMFAQGAVVLGLRQAQALIPQGAVREEGGAKFVYAVADGRLRRVPVSLGAASARDGRVEVVKGLDPGTTVVAANLGALPEGATARIAGAPR